MLRWEIVEGKQLVPIVPQTLARCRILRVVLLQEVVERGDRGVSRFRLPELVQRTFDARLHALRKLVQTLPDLWNQQRCCLVSRKIFLRASPEAECSGGDRQLWSNRQSSFLHVEHQFVPARFAFAVAVLNRDQFLLPLSSGSHEDQNALPFIGVVFEPYVDVNAIGLEVDVMLASRSRRDHSS